MALMNPHMHIAINADLLGLLMDGGQTFLNRRDSRRMGKLQIKRNRSWRPVNVVAPSGKIHRQDARNAKACSPPLLLGNG